MGNGVDRIRDPYPNPVFSNKNFEGRQTARTLIFTHVDKYSFLYFLKYSFFFQVDTCSIA
jgi:hypothetical protein